MTAIQKRGTRAKAGRARARAILVGGTFIALLAVAGVAQHGFSADPARPAPGSQYRGVVQFAGHDGECERFEFDNRTGQLSPQDRVWCGDRTASTGAMRRPTEPAGPLEGVRDYFKPR